MRGSEERRAKRRTENVGVGNKWHTRSHFRIRQASSVTKAMILNLHPIPLAIRFSHRSSEKGLWDYASCLAGEGVCYLAQHDILSQIPSLTTLVPPCPEVLESMKTKPLKVAAWLGTGGTKTPLHFDSYENVFVQIVGVKYVRIYPKSTTPRER